MPAGPNRNAPTAPAERNLPWVTAGICTLCALLHWLGTERAFGALEFERSAVLFHGELWRLWSGHCVHYSAAQLFLDTGVLLVCGTYVERRLTRGAMLVSAGLMPLAISLSLLGFDPGLQSYRGLSALSCAAAMFAFCLRWKEQPQDRWWILSAAALFAFEIAAVASGRSAGLGSLPPGISVAWRAHIIGVLLAVLGYAVRAASTNARAAARTRCG